MDEIRIHHAEIIAVVHRVDDLLAHAHKRSGAVGRKIEPAEQFLPQRFGREMDFGSGFFGRRCCQAATAASRRLRSTP